MSAALLIASKLISAGRGLAPALVRRAATIELDWDTRQKSRFDAVASTGRAIGVFLPRGKPVRGGDVLVADDGSLVVVKAKAQPVLVVTAADTLLLQRAAYHLGNRHVPLEVRADRLQLEPDHVLAEMLVRMGLKVSNEDGVFEPEAGAYDAATAHGHGSGHGHDHDHDQAHEHGHVHGPDCGHDHR